MAVVPFRVNRGLSFVLLSWDSGQCCIKSPLVCGNVQAARALPLYDARIDDQTTQVTANSSKAEIRINTTLRKRTPSSTTNKSIVDSKVS